LEPLTDTQPIANRAGVTLVPMPKEDSIVFSVRMPRELHQKLLEVSRADDSTLNRTLVVAARRYIRQMEARRPKDAQDGR
jgi:hypothetical protein